MCGDEEEDGDSLNVLCTSVAVKCVLDPKFSLVHFSLEESLMASHR
jgi:hypothetical protein